MHTLRNCCVCRLWLFSRTILVGSLASRASRATLCSSMSCLMRFWILGTLRCIAACTVTQKLQSHCSAPLAELHASRMGRIAIECTDQRGKIEHILARTCTHHEQADVALPFVLTTLEHHGHSWPDIGGDDSTGRKCKHPEAVHLPEGLHHRVCQAEEGTRGSQLNSAGELQSNAVQMIRLHANCVHNMCMSAPCGSAEAEPSLLPPSAHLKCSRDQARRLLNDGIK